MGHQLHSQDRFDRLPALLHRVGDADPTSLSATASMNLRLDHPRSVAQFLSTSECLLDIHGHHPARHWNLVLFQQLFCLVLMDLHNRFLSMTSGLVPGTNREAREKSGAIARFWLRGTGSRRDRLSRQGMGCNETRGGTGVSVRHHLPR